MRRRSAAARLRLIAELSPLRPRGVAAAAFIAFLIYMGRPGNESDRFILVFIAGLALAILAGFLLLALLASYLAFISGSRGSGEGSAARLASTARVYSGTEPSVRVGFPAGPVGVLVVMRAFMVLPDGSLSGPATLSRRSRESLLLGGQADVPDSLLGGEFDCAGLRSGRYEAAKVRLRFEDPLGLFRFSWTERGEGFAFTVFRVDEREAEILGKPDKSETETVSLERTRAEGELLEIRKYVPGSDPSRRIVWKLFARTGRLMIRDAEKENVNASRLPFFVSFEASPEGRAGRAAAEGLLDRYKSAVLAVMRALKAANFQLVYCAARRVPCLEAGDEEAFSAFDRELEPVEADAREEVEMASHPWDPGCGAERQARAWADKLRGMDAPRSRMILVTQGFDSGWASALGERGGGGVAYLVRLSAEFFTRKDKRSPATRLLVASRDERPWEIDSAASRARWTLLRDYLRRREDKALSEARSRSIEVVEL